MPDQELNVDELLAREFDAPAEPEAPVAAEEAPASSPGSEVVPTAAAEPEAPTAPVAPVTPPATPPTPSSQPDPFAQQVIEQNKALAAALQQSLEGQKAVMDRLLQEQKPELTQAQREERIQAAFKGLNEDPEAYITALVEQRAKVIEAEMAKKYAPRDEQIERQQTVNKHLASLHVNSQGQVLRPELADPNFVQKLVSPEVQKAVYDRYWKGHDPAALINNPAFYTDCYHEARTQLAGAQPEATQAVAQAAQDAQRKILQTHGNAASVGDGKSGTAPTKAQSEDENLVREMTSSMSPTARFLAEAEKGWRNRRG